MRIKKASAVVCFVFALGFLAAGFWLPAQAGNAWGGAQRVLSFDERVAWHRKVETVYWQHRIWQSPQPKPSLDEVFPASLLQRKVGDGLQKAQALERFFQHPVTSEQLRGEVERMTRQTRNPQMLRELFAALENDSFLIGEILARPALTETSLQDSYLADPRFQPATRDEAAPDKQRDQAEVETWWQTHKAEFGTEITSSAPSFALPLIAAEADDSWAPMPAPPVGGSDVSSVWTGVEAIIWNSGISGSRYNPTLDLTFPVSRKDAPPQRTTHTAVWTGQEMIVWGGHNGASSGDPFRVGWRYNPITDVWTQTSAANAPVPRDAHVSVWTGTEMIVWGGWDPVGNNLNSGGRYNPANDTWTPLTQANAPTGRLRARAVWTGQEMIIWGGTISNVGAQNTGGRYNPANDTWTATSTANAPAPRFNHTAVWTGSEMIIWAGNSSSTIFNSGGRYNPATDSWTATSVPALEARRQHSAVWTGSEMIVWGGCIDFQCSISRETGARYNPTNDTWTATAQTVGNNRSRHAAVWTGAEMIIAGGCRGGECNNPISNIIRYTPAANTWREARYEPLPIPPRQPHKAVWTGSEMLVWGVDAVAFNTSVYRYNPATNRWTRSIAANAPDARSEFSLVWTGTEMIAWGGDVQGLGLTQTGGRYNPMADTWTDTNITGAPSLRFLHDAVWTGTEMIVWGGARDNGTTTNTGARYNPANDTWASMTSINAPTGRVFHSVIWTGQEMIVWGGSNLQSSTYFNTGGRYNPATDTWVATSLANSPTPRNSHTGIWTGQEMIIWGGAANGALFNTGGRYNPATEAWIETSLTDAPTPRWIHSAVWTGSEMIIWGGLVNSAFPYLSTDTGARFDPTTGVWRATPLLRAPERRDNHTAVWTGSQMLIWGGVRDPDTTYTNTGGVYYVDTAPRVAPTSVVSRKLHGAAGVFDVPLPLAGTPGIECRSGGVNGDYQVVFTFASTVSFNGVAVTPETGKSGNLVGDPVVSEDGRSITVNLTNISDAQTVAITLSGINNGTNFNDVSAQMRVLVGDTNGSGVVSASDIGQTKANAGQPVTGATFRSDVVANGAINSSDIALVKSRSGAGTSTAAQGSPVETQSR